MQFTIPVHNSRLLTSGIRRHPSLADRWLPQRGWIRATLRKAEAARAAMLDAYALQKPPPPFLS